MSDTDFKISDLDAYSTTSTSDLVIVEDDSATDGTYYRATLNEFLTSQTLTFTANGTSNTMYIDVSGLPEGDLEITFFGRTDEAVLGSFADFRVGTTSPTLDSGTNYNSATAFTDPDTAASGSGSDGDAVDGIETIGGPGTSAEANQVGAMHLVIPDYKGTTYYKNVVGRGYMDRASAARGNTNLIQANIGGQWRNTAAIGVVGVVIRGTGNWVSGSTMKARIK